MGELWPGALAVNGTPKSGHSDGSYRFLSDGRVVCSGRKLTPQTDAWDTSIVS
jgi:hypothetical protein